MSFPSDMTAPPAGALEACLALLEEATPGVAVGCMRKDESVYVSIGDHKQGAHAQGDVWLPYDDVAAMVAAVNLLRTHGPALLAALRLREGCEGLVARIEREADAHTYFADNADLRMSTGDHAKRAAQLTTIRDDLARVLEEGE